MTESERMSISGLLDVLNTGISLSTCHIEYVIQSNVLEDLIRCLEELEQYRAIGTVKECQNNKVLADKIYEHFLDGMEHLEKYKEIGTVEEFKALKEKSVAKKVNIQQWIDTKCDCGYEFSKHHGDGYYSIPYEKQTKYCPECGQKLDFGEEE